MKGDFYHIVILSICDLLIQFLKRKPNKKSEKIIFILSFGDIITLG